MFQKKGLIVMKLKSKILAVTLLACILFAGHMLLSRPKHPKNDPAVPSYQVIVNPTDNNKISPNNKQTKIIHNVTIPSNISEPTTVPDVITSSDGTQVNDGVAEAIPNPDGSIEIKIPEVIVIKPEEPKKEQEYRLKLSYDIDEIGIAYELFQYKKFSIDGVIYADKAGLGLSYDVHKGIHLGLEGTASFQDGKLETRVYVSIPFAIR